MTSDNRQTIALFKRRLLPGTETFIRNQQDAYTRYRALAVGAQRLDSSLARDTDFLLYPGSGLVTKVKAKILSALGYSKELEQLLEEQAISLVHAHFAPEGFAVARTCKKLGIPLVVTFHGHDIHAAPNTPGLTGIRYRCRLKSLFKSAQHFIAVSEAVRQRALELGCPPEKITVEYTGVPEAESLRYRTEPQFDILFVGRLIPYKGTRHMLEAAAQAEEKLGRRLKIAVVGSGPEMESLQELAKTLKLEVDFLGHLPSTEVQSKLAGSKIFCAPSMKASATVLEGFGMVYLEASLQETPVVAYAFSGVKEAVADGESGLLVPEGNIALLAEALVKLLQNPELARELGERGRHRAIQEFSVARRVQSIEKIYDCLISP